jgi:hypothetical protein
MALALDGNGKSGIRFLAFHPHNLRPPEVGRDALSKDPRGPSSSSLEFAVVANRWLSKEGRRAYVPADGLEFLDCTAGGKTQADRELKIEAAVLRSP